MKLYLGIIIAAFMWFMMFSVSFDITQLIHHNYFWYAMAGSTFLLTIYSLVNQRTELKSLFKFEKKFVWIGIVHAILLYLLSRLGVWLLAYLFEGTVPQIEAIYQTRYQANPYLIGLLLFVLIAPAEEIFWRGFVQKSFMQKYGVKIGTGLGIFLYVFVHIWSFNPLLLLAALVLGVHWGLMYAKFNSIVPGIISHSIWDTMIFVILPITF